MIIEEADKLPTYTVRLLRREEVAENTMAFYFDKPAGFQLSQVSTSIARFWICRRRTPRGIFGLFPSQALPRKTI